MDNNQKKTKLPTIEMKIEVEVVDDDTDGKPRMSEKRKAFIREKNKKIHRWIAIFFTVATVASTFISNLVISIVCFVVCFFLALCFWGAYQELCPQERHGYTPWWYGAL